MSLRVIYGCFFPPKATLQAQQAEIPTTLLPKIDRGPRSLNRNVSLKYIRVCSTLLYLMLLHKENKGQYVIKVVCMFFFL